MRSSFCESRSVVCDFYNLMDYKVHGISARTLRPSLLQWIVLDPGSQLGSPALQCRFFTWAIREALLDYMTLNSMTSVHIRDIARRSCTDGGRLRVMQPEATGVGDIRSRKGKRGFSPESLQRERDPVTPSRLSAWYCWAINFCCFGWHPICGHLLHHQP